MSPYRNPKKRRSFSAWLKEHPRIRGVWSFLSHYVGGVYRRADARHIFLVSGGLAFSLMVCLIPLVLIVFAVVGMILDRPHISGEISAWIERVIPYQEYADFVKRLVFDRVREFTFFKTWAGVLGLVGILFASSGLFGSMRTILDSVYRVDTGESILVSKLRDFKLVLMVMVYFLLSTAILPLLDAVEQYAGKVEWLQQLSLGIAGDMFLMLVSFIIITIAFFVVYFFVPTKHPGKRVVLVSALASAFLWLVAKELFGVYLAHAANLKRIYGAYLLGIAVFFWIYYSAIVFVVGAEIGQLYKERRDESVPPPQRTHRFFG